MSYYGWHNDCYRDGHERGQRNQGEGFDHDRYSHRECDEAFYKGYDDAIREREEERRAEYREQERQELESQHKREQARYEEEQYYDNYYEQQQEEYPSPPEPNLEPNNDPNGQPEVAVIEQAKEKG